MPSCCSGIVTHFDVLVVGATVAGISAMLSAVSYGGQVALVDEQGVYERLREYFSSDETKEYQDFFDLQSYEETIEDMSVHLLEGAIALLQDNQIQVGDAEYWYDHLVVACGPNAFRRVGANSLLLRMNEGGLVEVDDAMCTSVPGVWSIEYMASSTNHDNHQSLILEGIAIGKEAAISH